MLCPNCKKTVKTTDIYCEYCHEHLGAAGSASVQKIETVETATKRCNNCNGEIPKSKFYCPLCGKITDVEIKTDYQAPAHNPFAKPALWLTPILPLGLLVSILGLIHCKRKKSGGKLACVLAMITSGFPIVAMTLAICVFLFLGMI